MSVIFNEKDWYERLIKCSFPSMSVIDGKKKPRGLMSGWSKLESSVIEDSHECQFVLTGEMNNILVVDFDNIDHFHELMKNGTIEDASSYPIVKTFKGVHMYFEYNNKVIQPDKKILNVDVQGNGKMVFSPPTKYTLANGNLFQYEWLNITTLKPIPDKLMDYINSCNKKLVEATLPTINKKENSLSPLPTNINENMKFVELITPEYLNNREDWLKIVFAMKREGFTEQEALRISNKANKCEPLTDEAWNATWNSEDSRNDGVSMGTIKYYAKLSNPTEYAKLVKYNPDDYGIQDVTETSMARIFMKEEERHIKYSQDSKMYYIYHNNNWRIEDAEKDKFARQFISDVLITFYNRQIPRIKNEYNQQIEEVNKKLKQSNNKDEIKELKAVIQIKENDRDNLIQEVKKQLLLINKTTWKNNVWKEVQSLISVNPTNIVFDTGSDQYYNIHFENGVYDIKKKEFRPRIYSDYVTKILPYPFIHKKDIEEKIINETFDFFKKVQPNEDMRRFQLSYLAHCITGDTTNQVMKINIGYSASNGKSTEIAIHQNTFPIYTCKLDRRTFNENFEKRHKQFLQLIREPIRLAYMEEMDRKKIDVEVLKDVVDGKKLDCEILFGTKEEKPIQCKLLTCSNKDFNMDADDGVKRRCRVEAYESRFVDNDDELDAENHIYKRVRGFEEKFNNDLYRNAYFHLLLEYIDDLYIPESSKELFNEIAGDYDVFTNTLTEQYIITKKEEDKVSKEDLTSYFELKSIKWEKVLPELKRLGLKYDRRKMINGKQGIIYGLQIMETE